jgi:DNA-binding HxlR family transcriptional regulator
MVKEEQKSIIQMVGKPYILEIMESLSEQPRRFVDLSDACRNEKTRTIRLRELERANLIETISIKVGKRSFVHYRLTEKGASILKEIVKINSPR